MSELRQGGVAAAQGTNETTGHIQVVNSEFGGVESKPFR